MIDRDGQGLEPMEQQAILMLGTVTLISCGLGLVFIHSSNTLLKGLNWMGLAMMCGGLATGLMLVGLSVPGVQPVAYLMTLLAFMGCYRADQYLLCHEARESRMGYALITAQAAMIPLQWLHLTGNRSAEVVMSATIAIQMEITIRLLRRTSTGHGRFPARFTAGLMRFLVLASVARGVAIGTGWLRQPGRAQAADLASYTLFIAVAVALGFAFFWRTTTKLTGELEDMASTDPLTRVFNRRVFLAWCDKELQRSRESGLLLSVLLLDFDHFKNINDRFGHHIGDEVLCAAVERMQDSIRGIDVLCRWGGEEFAVLLPNASAEATLVVAERIRQNVLQVNSGTERFARQVSEPFQLTISVGAASLAHRDDDVGAMLQRADEALYAAKHAGRNRVVLAPRPKPGLREPDSVAPELALLIKST